jgi:tRNA-2-methylthio-N6-dimethylallyladenosine synthase
MSEDGRRAPLTKKLFIKTYGCQMNVYDSQRMADVLAPLGYSLAASSEAADMVILNTCHIREKAAEKVYSELGRIKEWKRRAAAAGRTPIVAVAGCVAQAEGEEIPRRAPQVDIVFGPQVYHRLPELVARAERQAGGVIATDFPVEPKFDHLPAGNGPAAPAAYLSIQEGCDRFCTFCVVPYTRGAEYSRNVAEVEAEARRLVARGAREITLLGQNVNAYHGTGPDGRAWRLGRLIAHLAEIDGLERLRYTTSHPVDMDEELIDAHGSVPQLMPYLHLPVQSGSDRILARMNRRHEAHDYLSIVERLRDKRSDIALSSDFIVGFPGESDADFAATLTLINEVTFAQAYSFKYSPRPGTPAALGDDQVAEPVKAERLAMVQELLNAQQMAFNQGSVGRVQDVLFERAGRRAGQLVGRGPYMQAVHARAPTSGGREAIGTIVPVEIVTAHPNSLAGEVLLAGPKDEALSKSSAIECQEPARGAAS